MSIYDTLNNEDILFLGETNIDNTYSNKQKTCAINAEYRDKQQVVKHAKDKYQ